ncbi:TetR/AcrR family transcriptional regulator [Methylobacterium gnaphalii]|uniref:TetR family transcriptional regulator n=1 Tax=Methylobacterium gnaphalii TaxID=1010610 RepID=A0A512JJ90_9HYPH|nr:TetR/AcrR family transcriptional regulator [Methylobacterium gnaphalii]GEP09942.1 TetR family transcriptional regulator [Methylobacterium gnaphalii]GJD68283.1 HTH-type transcriptional regulator BetI [Methylobacterium gnaphalii]GLS51797.1 TetR family transcriptional regulator [Methylobacterium gnaphalii]
MEPRTRSRREDRPEVILDAAESVMRRQGARALTIDAVAAEAALSKGGVLHHYASKDALICALAKRKLQRLREGIAAHEASQHPPSASPALAMIANARDTYCEEGGFPRALLVASAETPNALADFRTFVAERLDQMARIEGRPGAGAVLTFAIIGLLVGRTLGFHDLTGEQADRVFDALEVLAGELGAKG